MSEPSRTSLLRPNVQTPFHIDFDWWSARERNWRLFLANCLCPEHKAAYSAQSPDAQDQPVDWVDAETGEVRQVDGMQYVLMNHCSKQPGFITEDTPLVDAVFRVLLSVGNEPQTAEDFSRAIHKPAEVILRILSTSAAYRGIRPVIAAHAPLAQ